MKTKIILSLALVACFVIAGFVMGRARYRQQQSELTPYRILQRQDKVFDDGRVEPQMSLEIFTASDGTTREIRTNLNHDGSVSGVIEQFISPTLGSFLIYRAKNTYQKFNEPAGPPVKLSPQQARAVPGFDRTELLSGGLVAYVKKWVSESGDQSELWHCPELGKVVMVRSVARPANKNYQIVRRTLSIEPSEDAKAQVDLSQYRRLEDANLQLNSRN